MGKIITLGQLQGLHMMQVHHPEEAIQRCFKMVRPDGKPRYHKILFHGNKCDWIQRMPKQDMYIVRNVDISEEAITNENAESLGRSHAEAHAAFVKDAISKGVDPNHLLFEGRNEPQPNEFQFLARYECARIARAQELGVPRLMLFTFSVGQPATYGWRPDTIANWEIYEPARKVARPGDLYGCHQYCGLDGPNATWSNGDMRWPNEGNRLLQCPWEEAKWVITEHGADDGVNGNAKQSWWNLVGRRWGNIDRMNWEQASQLYLEWIRWMEMQYLADGRILGVMLFTHDYENNEWEQFNVDNQVFWPYYERYILGGEQVQLWGDDRVSRWQPILGYRANKVGVDPAVAAVILCMASGGKVLISTATTCGLMGVGFKEAGRADRPEKLVALHPDRNIMWGTQIFKQLVDQNGGDLTKAVQSYFGDTAAASTFVTIWNQLFPGTPCPVKKDGLSPSDDAWVTALKEEFGSKLIDLRGQLAHGATPYESRSLKTIDKIIVHHTASPKNTTWQAVALYHVNTRAWPGIAYHIGISPDGTVSILNDLTTISYHAGAANATSIGLCVTGNYETDAVDQLSVETLMRVVKVLDSLIQGTKLMGHKDFDGSTLCPGKNLEQKVSILRPEIQFNPRQLIALADSKQVMQLNSTAALQKAMFADNFVPTSNEFDADIDLVAQRAENLATGLVRVYFCKKGDWGNVQSIDK